MRIKLVNPCSNKLRPKGAQVRKKNGTRARMAPWGLCCVAAATPKEHNVVIEDEMNDELNLNDNPDLVGITVIAAASSSRAYEIADHYRSRGVPVVLGGIQATAIAHEAAIQHADAVVAGEVETVWDKVLADLQNGKMKGVYKGDRLHDLKGLPWPRLDLIQQKAKYDVWQYVQATRGCPYKCDFCSSTHFWEEYRERPVDEIIEEMKGLDRRKGVMLMDEFVGVNKEYYAELLEKMIPLKLMWFCQTGVKTMVDPQMLSLFAKSGCKYVFIGFESPNKSSLKGEHKYHNDPALYIDVVRKCHENGIMVQGGFVLGLDSDDPGTFRRVQDFIEASEIDTVQFNLVYPYPGTPLRNRLLYEDRITSNDFDNYIFDGVNFIPSGMTQKELNQGYNWILGKNSTSSVILKRSFKKMMKGQFRLALLSYIVNGGTRRSYKHVLRNLKSIEPVRKPTQEQVAKFEASMKCAASATG